MDTELRYQSYLLKIWRDPATTNHAWRLLLIDVQSGRRLGFSRPDDFLTYLRGQIAPLDDEDATVGSDSRGPPTEDAIAPN